MKQAFIIIILLFTFSCDYNNNCNELSLEKKKHIKDSLLEYLEKLDTLGRINEGENIFNKILTFLPNDSDIIFRLAIAKMFHKKSVEALILINKTIPKDSFQHYSYCNAKRMIFYDLVQYDSCIYYTDKVFEKDSAIEKVVLLVNWLSQSNQKEKAYKVAVKYSQIEKYKYQFYALRSDLSFEMGNYEAALEEVEIAKPYVNKFDYFYFKGYINFALKNYKVALDNMNKAIDFKKYSSFFNAENEKFSNAYDIRALTKVKLGDTLTAIKDLKISIKMGSQAAKEHYRQADSILKSKGKSIENYRR